MTIEETFEIVDNKFSINLKSFFSIKTINN